MIDPTVENIFQIAASLFFLIAIFLVAIGQTDRVRNDYDTLFNVNLSAFVFGTLATFLAQIIIMELTLDNAAQLVTSLFFLIAVLLITIGQTDRVRNDSNTLFGTNVSAFVFGSIAALMAIFITFMNI